MVEFQGKTALRLLAVAATLVLASCGSDENADVPNNNHGPNVTRVVSFGDSLSDLGTYSAFTTASGVPGAGQFTTNTGTATPASLWVNSVATYYGTAISKNRTQGFGMPTVLLGGTGYAQGGSRVALQPGINCAPAGVPPVCTAASTVPVTDQITAYLLATGGGVPGGDLILILAGNNDMLFQLGVFSASVGAGVPVATAQAAALAGVQAAATALVGQVRRLLGAGGNKIVVVSPFDLVPTPFGASVGPAAALLSGMLLTFNNVLVSLSATPGVELVAAPTFQLLVSTNPAAYGFINTTTPGCNAAAMPPAAAGSSLFCIPPFFLNASVPNNYLYADSVHPTTQAHAMFGQFVIQQIAGRIPR
jgi:phospholipase/lecithinase/hemolysin